MPLPPLPEIETAAQRLAEALPDTPAGTDAIWQVEGPATAGKSSCLALVASLLQGTSLKPILVAPPAHHLDTAPAALVDVAIGLASHELLNGQFDTWLGEHNWAARVNAVKGWVTDNADEVVLLFDEPQS